LLESDYGPVGFKLDGSGHLARRLRRRAGGDRAAAGGAGCDGGRATLYGRVSIDDERPAFEGPLRFARSHVRRRACGRRRRDRDRRTADKLLASFDGEPACARARLVAGASWPRWPARAGRAGATAG
jgi:hypothetical protein